MSALADVSAIVDVDRYPVGDLDDPRTQRVVADARASLAQRGVVALPGFLRPSAVDTIVAEVETSLGEAHLEDVWGTPYLDLPDETYPEGHPRRTMVLSRTWVLAYDLVSATCPARVLYEWDGLTNFLATVLDRWPLYRMADPLGALNLTAMLDGHVQGWHYDSTDFVVSLALQTSAEGGEFECARDIRNAGDECYDDVVRVLQGNGSNLVEVYPMTPGTLMVFTGRYSIHRVAPVAGARPRVVALFGYDTKPDTTSSDLLKLVRYGRTEPRDAATT
jgi:hypothetical protein